MKWFAASIPLLRRFAGSMTYSINGGATSQYSAGNSAFTGNRTGNVFVGANPANPTSSLWHLTGTAADLMIFDTSLSNDDTALYMSGVTTY